MQRREHTHTFTCHDNGSSWSSGQKRGFSCTLSLTGRPSACPGYAQPVGSQICSGGQWNDQSHGLNHHNQESDTSCFKDKAQICFPGLRLENPDDIGKFSADLLWKLYLLVLGWLIGLQGTEEGYDEWPVAGVSLTPVYIQIHRDEPLMLTIKRNICENQLPGQIVKCCVTTVWLLCFGVTWGNFEWVASRLTPARWVDVRVIWVHPFIIDVTPTIIMDLKEKYR